MSIARYTQHLMNQLERNGRCYVAVTPTISIGAARSRIQNAARQLGVKVKTRNVKVCDYHKVHGVVVKESNA